MALEASEKMMVHHKTMMCRIDLMPLGILTHQQIAVFVRPLTESLMQTAEVLHPRNFQCGLGAILANVVGNLPDDYWQEAKKVGPCSIPGCLCHVPAKAVMEALDLLRNDHIETMKKRPKVAKN